MLVTLASRYMSNFRMIPDLYAKVLALYTKVPDFCANISFVGFYCDGNVRGRVPIGCLWSVANDIARTACG